MAGGVAFVTGARQGMGAEIAGRLARDGYAIAALDVLPCDDVVGEIEAAGGSVVAYRADVRSWQEVAGVVEAVESRQGPIEVLASVVGVWESVPFLELTPETWHRILDVNLEGSFNVCRLVTERMAAREDASPGGGTHGAGGVETVETQSGAGHRVQIGRLDLLQAVIADVAPTLIVRHAQDDVGSVSCFPRFHRPEWTASS